MINYNIISGRGQQVAAKYIVYIATTGFSPYHERLVGVGGIGRFWKTGESVGEFWHGWEILGEVGSFGGWRRCG